MGKNLFKTAYSLFFILILISNNSYAKTEPALNPFHLEIINKKITIKAQNVNFKDILKEIEKKSEIKVKIFEKVEDSNVSVDVKDIPLNKIEVLFEKMKLKSFVIYYDKESNPYEIWMLSTDKNVNNSTKGKIVRRNEIIRNAKFTEDKDIDNIKGKSIISKSYGKNKVLIRYVKNEIFLKFHRGVTKQEIKDILGKYNLVSKEENTLSKIGYVKAEILGDRDIESVIKEISKEYKLKTSEPNYISNVFAITDPLYENQWYIPDTNFDKAWPKLKNKKVVKIAVIDTGVNSKHPDLKNKILQGFDFVNNDSTSLDDNGHGTFVAGIIAGASNNIGIKGLFDSAKIIPIKTIDGNGAGTYEDVAKGIIYAADNGAKVINLSVGGYAYSFMLLDAVDYALTKGCIVVASGGNDGIEQEIYPAGYADVIGVSALDQNGQIWNKSNSGKHIDVCAPGVNILSLGLDENYVYASGTSASAPMISALAAMLVSEKPDVSSSVIEKLIMQSAKDLGDKGRDKVYGSGEIDALSVFGQEVKLFHDIAVRSVYLEPMVFDKDKLTYVVADIENVGTYRAEKCNVALYQIIGEEKKEIGRKTDVVVSDKLDVVFDWEPDGVKDGVKFEVVVVYKDDSNNANNSKITRLFFLREDGKLYVLYATEPPVHQWIALQAYKLTQKTSLKNEIGKFLDTSTGSLLYSPNFNPNNYGWNNNTNLPTNTNTALIEGTWEEDEGTRPINHFWDPDGGYNDGILLSDSALKSAVSCFDSAIANYKTFPTNAYYWLGRTAHLLMDMSVPAHVHNDQHLEKGFFKADNPENYELYTAYVPLSGVPIYKESNTNNSNLSIPDVTKLPDYWDTEVPQFYPRELVRLFYNLAEITDNCDSDDIIGEVENGNYNRFASRVELLFRLKSISSIIWYRQTINGNRSTGTSQILFIDRDFEYDRGDVGTVYEITKPAIYLYPNIAQQFDEKSYFEEEYDVLEVNWIDEENISRTSLFDNLEDTLIGTDYSIVPTSVFDRRDTFNKAIGYIAALYQFFWNETHRTISGQVISNSSVGIDGITIYFSNNGGSVVTSGGGYYTIDLPIGWSGSATPSYLNFSFAPSSINYTNVNVNQDTQNFT